MSTGKKKQTICLVAIVRQEADIIIRLLDSTVTIIDFISIVDTGSTDNTSQLIKKWGKRHRVPTTVHHDPWRKDFGYSRTLSYRLAQQTYPQATYMLLTDADFIWHNDGFDKHNLTEPIYNVNQYMPKGYSNCEPRLLRNDRLARARLVVHEFWWDYSPSPYDPSRDKPVAKLWIEDRADGGCKSDKYERDEMLIKEAVATIEQDPNHPDRDVWSHYFIMMAQTLYELKRWVETITWAQRYIDYEQKGYKYERLFMAYKFIGHCYYWLAMEQQTCIRLVDKAEETFTDYERAVWTNRGQLSLFDRYQQLQSYQTLAETNYNLGSAICLHRAETLYHCAFMWCYYKNYNRAYYYLTQALPLKNPGYGIVVESNVYDYRIDSLLLAVIFFVSHPVINRKSEGQAAYQRLLARIKEDAELVPETVQTTAARDVKYYETL